MTLDVATLERNLKRTPEQVDQEPILKAMAAWLDGSEKVPTRDEFIDRFGKHFTGFIWDTPNLDTFTGLNMTRYRAIERFGFVIPSAELLEALADHAPIVEVGAGSGYLTALMRNRGIDVIGTDLQDEKYGFKCAQHDARQELMSALEAVRHYPDHTLFCAWPSLNSKWLRSALKELPFGHRAIIVEEECCAEKSTWNYRDRNFTMEQSIPIPRWPYIRDYAAVWRKS